MIVYKAVGKLEDGLYCSAVLHTEHPLSTRYRLGKVIIRTKRPVMAFSDLDEANFFLTTSRDVSTKQQAILECEAKLTETKAVELSKLYTPIGLARLLAGDKNIYGDIEDVVPPFTVCCRWLKPIKEIVCVPTNVSEYSLSDCSSWRNLGWQAKRHAKHIRRMRLLTTGGSNGGEA
jgi:hypothetical protein